MATSPSTRGTSTATTPWTRPPANPTTSHTYDTAGTYTVTLTVTDDEGTESALVGKSVTVFDPVVPPSDAFGALVFGYGPDLYWRLGEAAGTTAVDASASRNNGGINGTVDLGAPGALDGLSDTAYTFRKAGQGETGGHVVASQQVSDPSVYTVERGVPHRDDRGRQDHRLRQPAFRPVDQLRPSRLHAGRRHPCVRGLDRLCHHHRLHRVVQRRQVAPGGRHAVRRRHGAYVDGVLIGTDPQSNAQAYDGYWRIGGDNTWNSTSPFFVGDIDEAFVLGQALTETQVTELFTTANLVEINDPPVADFTVDVDGLTVSVDASGSTDDGTITDWTWDFGGPGTGDTTGESTTFTYDDAGTYTISLTVTDDNGQTSDAATSDVTVSAIPVADFTVDVDGLTVDRGRLRLHRRRQHHRLGVGLRRPRHRQHHRRDHHLHLRQRRHLHHRPHRHRRHGHRPARSWASPSP